MAEGSIPNTGDPRVDAALERIRGKFTDKRSFFRLLALINSTCRAFATITSCPNAIGKRLTHGECPPTSMAIRQRRSAPDICIIPFWLVGTLPSSVTSPVPFRTQ